jgi:hypothetical protein
VDEAFADLDTDPRDDELLRISFGVPMIDDCHPSSQIRHTRPSPPQHGLCWLSSHRSS